MILKTWVMAFRPKTLTAAVVPVFVATALLLPSDFPIRWWITLAALASALFIQIGTNLINDGIDFKKGADDENRLGPKRATQSGLLKYKTVMAMGFVSFLIAIVCGIPLVMQGGWVIAGIGVVSLICGYAYTGGPYPLAYRGLGDLFVIIFFGIVAVGGVYYLHTEGFHLDALVAGLQVGLLCTVLIAINKFNGAVSDKFI
ncbi:1,4-dihydroxy-2-naphthoate octaprenyltransferase [Candidatus Kaiserbacteria bacterium]|nr:MAG: 1,4-dihydroxy-2-naphthoate octaprenyltransferase [Candidatus Kaiserbacteria bacterium]